MVSSCLLEDLLSGPLTFVRHSFIHCFLSQVLSYEVMKTKYQLGKKASFKKGLCWMSLYGTVSECTEEGGHSPWRGRERCPRRDGFKVILGTEVLQAVSRESGGVAVFSASWVQSARVTRRRTGICQL